MAEGRLESAREACAHTSGALEPKKRSGIMNDPTTKILHIRPERAAEAAVGKMDALLVAAASDVDSCSDVYRGLARSGHSGPDAPRAVIVCVDGLGAAEMEFFHLFSRLRRGVKVYVYASPHGGERSTSRMARAIELGATGLATEDVIRRLAKTVSHPAARADIRNAPNDDRSPAQTSAESTPAPPPIAKSPDTDALEESVPVVTEEPPVAHPDELEADKAAADDDTLEGPVRVPWLRYNDGPSRVAPRRRGPPAADPAVIEPAPSRSAPRRPLITSEELQALLGDDIAAIAPDDGPESQPHEHGGAGSDEHEDRGDLP